MINRKVNNPAGRLHEILQAVRSAQGGNRPMREVWADVFFTEARNTVDVLHYVAEVVQLTRDCRKIAAMLPDVDNKLYLAPFIAIETAFVNLNFDEPWEAFCRRIDDSTMTGLQFCSDYFSREVGEGPIDDDLLNLQLVVCNLLETVIAADIDDGLKEALVRALEDIRRAILEYRIRGADGLRTALEGGIGAVARYRDEIAAIKNPEETGISGVMQLMRRLDVIVSTGLKVKQLAGPIISFLQLPGGGPGGA